MQPVRALVVGAGETSMLMHLPVLAALQKLGRLELVEICDLRLPRAAEARRRFGFRREGGDAMAAIAKTAAANARTTYRRIGPPAVRPR